MEKSIPSTVPATLNSQMLEGKPVYLIDVRSPAEYYEGHANGALSIPIDELDVPYVKTRFDPQSV